MALEIVRTIKALRGKVNEYRRSNETIGLIPTMGALHDGHLSLIAAAKKLTQRQIVSIFVNPTQFGKNEDFSTYPRDEAADIAKLRHADLLFAPELAEIYPPLFDTKIEVGGLTRHLCGPKRPGHFSGVATVVTKLLMQSLPDIAFFGEKDFQQLRIIQKLVRDLDIPVEIVGVPTMREEDGLAMSSRNRYLTPEERILAGTLPQILQDTIIRLQQGEDIESALTHAHGELRAAGFTRIDYIELADSENLQPARDLKRPCRLFAAVYLGQTRLIDNWPVAPLS